MSRADDEGDFPYISGFGTIHSLREQDEPGPRLAGLRSVKNTAGGVIRPKPPQPARVIGFHRPR